MYNHQSSKPITDRQNRIDDHPDNTDQKLNTSYLNSCATDVVFVTLLRTAVETAISGAHKLFRTCEVLTALINIVVVLAVVHGLLGPCGSESADEPLTLSPAPSFSVSVGSDGQSHRTVPTNHNLFEEKGEPKRYRTEVLPLISLTPYR